MSPMRKSINPAFNPIIRLSFILWAVGLAVCAGCTGVKSITLSQDEGVRGEFKDLKIDFDAYVFFSAVSESDPDSILAIKKEFVEEFNPKGWTSREKTEVPDLIRGLVSRAPIKWGYGMIVTGEDGVVKGKLYSRFDRHKVFVYNKQYFTVQTPDMVFKKPIKGIFSPTPSVADD